MEDRFRYSVHAPTPLATSNRHRVVEGTKVPSTEVAKPGANPLSDLQNALQAPGDDTYRRSLALYRNVQFRLRRNWIGATVLIEKIEYEDVIVRLYRRWRPTGRWATHAARKVVDRRVRHHIRRRGDVVHLEWEEQS